MSDVLQKKGYEHVVPQTVSAATRSCCGASVGPGSCAAFVQCTQLRLWVEQGVGHSLLWCCLCSSSQGILSQVWQSSTRRVAHSGLSAACDFTICLDVQATIDLLLHADRVAAVPGCALPALVLCLHLGGRTPAHGRHLGM